MDRTRQLLFTTALMLWIGLAPGLARADDDPPGRVGRIAALQGDVSMYDHEAGGWVPAERNRPLVSGDRIATDPGARAELEIGSTTLRLGGDSQLDVLRLDDASVRLQLQGGSLALHLRAKEVAAEIRIVSGSVELTPLSAGLFRIDRADPGDDFTAASSWRGQLQADDREVPLVVDAGQRAELWREGARQELRHRWTPVPDDDFSAWVLREDRADDRGGSADAGFVSPEMTGAQDLARYGRWEQTAEYGAVWLPADLASGWAPYRDGRWTWILPWGWTWVDEAPWGFAPFHYGRWVHWAGQWCWAPGAYIAQPVYAPALVAWIGGPRFSVSISVGAPALPAVGWVPLAPFERFVPYYRGSPHYVDRINHRPPGRPPHQVPTGPIMYGNQGVPGAVTVVPRDVLVHREPVARAVVRAPYDERLQRVTPPPPAPMRRTPELPPVRRAPVPLPDAGRRPPPAERGLVPRPGLAPAPRPGLPPASPPAAPAAPAAPAVPTPPPRPVSRPQPPQPIMRPAVPAPRPAAPPVAAPAPVRPVPPAAVPQPVPRPASPAARVQPPPATPGEPKGRGALAPLDKREPPADDKRRGTPESRNPNPREQQN